MKNLILFLICISCFACLEDESQSFIYDETYEDETDSSSPYTYEDPVYRGGCGEETKHIDPLGNIYFLPILCNPFFIDKGRPSDKSFLQDSGNNYEQDIVNNIKSFSQFDG